MVHARMQGKFKHIHWKHQIYINPYEVNFFSLTMSAIFMQTHMLPKVKRHFAHLMLKRAVMASNFLIENVEVFGRTKFLSNLIIISSSCSSTCSFMSQLSFLNVDI
uniref:Uncharacterized protein n=1 Tax=Glossina brevipalpis TaxID=37001 RepID=A0A1A9WHN5_9MUSC